MQKCANMDTLKILEMEAVNRNCIYLHREGPEWYAYEVSAFYLNSAFQVKRIEQVVDNVYEVRLIRIPLGKNPEEFFCGQEVVEYENGVMRVMCKSKCGGFSIWKSCFVY